MIKILKKQKIIFNNNSKVEKNIIKFNKLLTSIYIPRFSGFEYFGF